MTALAVKRWPKDVPVHPAAELFPLMAGEAFAELVADVRTNGLMEPIVRTYEGEILDGRNRFLACVETGKKLRYVAYTGNPWTFVISTNLHRRHLTDTQRAIIAGKIADRAVGRPIEEMASAEAINGEVPSRIEAAELLHVSRSSVERARRIQRNGTEGMKALTESGQVPLATADRLVSSLDPEEQDEFVRKVEAGMTPRTAAPSDIRPPRSRIDPDDGKRRRARPAKDSSVIGSDALTRLATEMNGIDLALKPVVGISDEITPGDCIAWEAAFTRGIRALYRLRKLVKSHLGEQP